MLVVVWNLEK